MNKFCVGDIVYIPQGMALSSSVEDGVFLIVNKPSIVTYLGVSDNENLHKVDFYGQLYYIRDNEIENLNFYIDKGNKNANQTSTT